MDIRHFFQVFLLVLFVENSQGMHPKRSLLTFDADWDTDDGPSFGRCPWIRNKLKNGRVRYRYKGRVAKFLCDSGYDLAGKRSSTCVRGQWSNPIPVCVARGCSRVPSIANGHVTEMYRGALLVYDCNPGYTLDGVASIHCDGRRWSSGPPICVVATEHPDLSCDFESPELCGWSHDPSHEFDWKRNQFSTPSGHAGTGPSSDHTFGEKKGGYYLYIEASSPRKINDTARLFSPVYSPGMSGGCFLFWYHMYGATTGGLRIYLKPESYVFDELLPNWEKFGNQGNKWNLGNFPIPVLKENFQIVIEGIRGESYVGDSAIDDVTLTTQDCESMENETGIVEHTVAESCRGRCREEKDVDSSSSCGCNDNCYEAHNCCSDYTIFCYEGNDTTVHITDETLPSEITSKTSPSTSPPTVTTQKTTEESLTSSSLSSSKMSTSSTASTILQTSSVTLPSIPATSISSPVLSSNTTSTPQTMSSTQSTSPYINNVSTTPLERNNATSTVSTTVKSFPSSTSSSKLEMSSTTVMATSSSVASLGTTASSKASTPKSSATRSTSTTTSVPTTITSTTPVKTTTTTTTRVETTILQDVATSIFTSLIPTSVTTTSAPISTSIRNASPSSTTDLTSSKPITINTSVTTESTTRKTYNLRPRTRQTTAYVSTTNAISVTESISHTEAFITPSTKTIAVTSNAPSKDRFSTERKTAATYSTWHSAPVSIFYTTSTTRRPLVLATTSTTKARTSTTKATTVPSPRTQYTKRFTITQFTPQIFRLTSTQTPSTYATSTDSKEMGASNAETTASNSSTAIVISLIVVIICISAGIAYYMRKNKNKRQSKLSDDSEMRFLQENEHMEYSDASALDRILIK